MIFMTISSGGGGCSACPSLLALAKVFRVRRRGAGRFTMRMGPGTSFPSQRPRGCRVPEHTESSRSSGRPRRHPRQASFSLRVQLYTRPMMCPIGDISRRDPGVTIVEMGQFHVPARLTGPTGLTESTDLLVDTG